jgi:hypothetical protein
MIFNMTTSYFHKISFHYFKGLFNDETDLRVRYNISVENIHVYMVCYNNAQNSNIFVCNFNYGQVGGLGFRV